MQKSMADKVITDAGVIEQIRAALPVATASRNGLMSTADKIFQFLSNANVVRNPDNVTENGIYNFNSVGSGGVAVNGEQWGVLIHFASGADNISAQILITSHNMFAYRIAYSRSIAGVSWIILRNAS